MRKGITDEEDRYAEEGPEHDSDQILGDEFFFLYVQCIKDARQLFDALRHLDNTKKWTFSSWENYERITSEMARELFRARKENYEDIGWEENEVETIIKKVKKYYNENDPDKESHKRALQIVGELNEEIKNMKGWELFFSTIGGDEAKFRSFINGEAIEIKGSQGGIYKIDNKGHITKKGKVLNLGMKEGKITNTAGYVFPDVLATIVSLIVSDEKHLLQKWGCGKLSIQKG